jgi:hypothetical protein
MTRQKIVVMMETMATRNQIEKSNLMIFWMKNGVSSCLKEELNSSMKSNEKCLIENISRVSLISYSCFTILTINLIVLGVKIVS